MKKLIGMVLCLIPAAALAQQTYTNEDLKKFSVPGAYTNQDLKKLPPLPKVTGVTSIQVPEPPARQAGPNQQRYDRLSEQRLVLKTELDWRLDLVRKTNSGFDKGWYDDPSWPEYLRKSAYEVAYNRSAIQHLELQIQIVDALTERVRDDARRAGEILEEH